MEIPEFRRKSTAVWGVWFLFAIASIAYLASDPVLWIQAAGFFLCLIVPSVAMGSQLAQATRLPVDCRILAGMLLVIPLFLALYYLKRFLPLPVWASDLLLSFCLWGGAWKCNALREFVRLRRSPSMNSGLAWIFILVSVTSLLVHSGVMVENGAEMRFYGLSTVDLGNLANMVTLIRVSPGLPSTLTANGQPLTYHWWFFVLPAWMADFCGGSSRSISALMICNLLPAHGLAFGVVWAARRFCRGRACSERALHLAAVLSIAAPFTWYAYHVVLRILGPYGWVVEGRNSLLLSVVNSMCVFGNNTSALAACLLIAACLVCYRKHPNAPLASLIGLTLILLFGLSATLALPMAMTVATWFVIGRCPRPVRFAIINLLIGGAGLMVLKWTHVLGGSNEHLALSFDRFLFVRNIIFGMASCSLLVILASVWRRELSPYLIAFVAGILVPSFIDLAGSRTGPAALSMKIGSYLAVLASPLFVFGLCELYATGQRKAFGIRMLQGVVGILLLAGFLNAAVYMSQFVVSRSVRPISPYNTISADYVRAMDFIRRNSPKSASIIDIERESLPESVATTILCDRQPWSPTLYTLNMGSDNARSDLLRRKEIVERWEEGHYSDPALSAAVLDGGADYVVSKSDITDQNWQLKSIFGAYRVYCANRQK